MYHAQIRMAAAMAIWMSTSYCQAPSASLNFSLNNLVKTTWERQADSPDSKKQSNSSKSPELDKLPEGKGRDVTVRLCTKCHSATVFVVQRHNLDGWYNVIDQMTGKGLQASDQDIETVARYLSASFPAVSTEAPQKPMALFVNFNFENVASN